MGDDRAGLAPETAESHEATATRDATEVSETRATEGAEIMPQTDACDEASIRLVGHYSLTRYPGQDVVGPNGERPMGVWIAPHPEQGSFHTKLGQSVPTAGGAPDRAAGPETQRRADGDPDSKRSKPAMSSSASAAPTSRAAPVSPARYRQPTPSCRK